MRWQSETSKVVILYISFMAVSISSSFGWTTQTPMGITIKATQPAVDQYNKHWYIPGPSVVYPLRPNAVNDNAGCVWDNISWQRLDQFYKLLRDKHGGVPNADPESLKIVIRTLQYSCVDEEPGSYEMKGCIDGYFPTDNTIWIHLGDDSGQGEFAFCNTALSHELNHYFLRWKGNPHWASENPVYHFDVQELCQQ